MTAVIILAAGASNRLGRPKQLLLYRGKTLLQHTIYEALATGCTWVVVVLGAYAEVIRSSIENEPVIIGQNPHWEQGMGSSIATGMLTLAEAAPQADELLLMLCDQPFADRHVLQQLLDTARTSGRGVVASAYGDTLGAPAFFVNRYFSELRTLPAAGGAKVLFHKYKYDLASVAFPGGDLDIDTVQDYEKLQP